MGGEADAVIIIFGGGSGEEGEEGVGAEGGAGLADEFEADALALVIDVDGEVGEVAAIGEIGEGAGEPDEAVAIPGADG